MRHRYGKLFAVRKDLNVYAECLKIHSVEETVSISVTKNKIVTKS